jgi:hypothetical protein
MEKKGGIAALLIGSPSKKSPMADDEEAPMTEGADDGQIAKETAMASFMDAVKGEDTSAALEAFERVMEVCGQY